MALTLKPNDRLVRESLGLLKTREAAAREAERATWAKIRAKQQAKAEKEEKKAGSGTEAADVAAASVGAAEAQVQAIEGRLGGLCSSIVACLVVLCAVLYLRWAGSDDEPPLE